MTLARAFESCNDNVIVERECALIILRNVRKVCDRHIHASYMDMATNRLVALPVVGVIQETFDIRVNNDYFKVISLELG